MKNRWLEPLRRQLTAPGSSRKRRKKGHRSSLVAAEVCESRVLLSGSSMADGGAGHQAALALFWPVQVLAKQRFSSKSPSTKCSVDTM